MTDDELAEIKERNQTNGIVAISDLLVEVERLRGEEKERRRRHATGETATWTMIYEARQEVDRLESLVEELAPYKAAWSDLRNEWVTPNSQEVDELMDLVLAQRQGKS